MTYDVQNLIILPWAGGVELDDAASIGEEECLCRRVNIYSGLARGQGGVVCHAAPGACAPDMKRTTCLGFVGRHDRRRGALGHSSGDTTGIYIFQPYSRSGAFQHGPYSNKA